MIIIIFSFSFPNVWAFSTLTFLSFIIFLSFYFMLPIIYLAFPVFISSVFFLFKFNFIQVKQIVFNHQLNLANVHFLKKKVITKHGFASIILCHYFIKYFNYLYHHHHLLLKIFFYSLKQRFPCLQLICKFPLISNIYRKFYQKSAQLYFHWFQQRIIS